VRRFLAPLADMAQETGCAILYVMHMNKGDGVDPMNRVSGSVAFTAAARSVIVMAKPEECGPTERIVAHVKCNVAELATPQRWRLEPILMDGPRQETTARMVFDGLADIDIYALLAKPLADDERGDRARAEEMLRDMLSFGEDIPTADVERRARAEGISERTLNRARAALGVKAVRVGTQWYVRLPVTNKGANSKGANLGGTLDIPVNHAGSDAQTELRVPLGTEGTLAERSCYKVGSAEWMGVATRAEIARFVNGEIGDP
jgi:hypothetical protein